MDNLPPMGSYVLATKWEDGDPGDNWAVGLYAGIASGTEGHGREVRHLVVDDDGKILRASGFRRIRGPLRADVGAWLLRVSRHLEASPPGTVSLWSMLDESAFNLADDRGAEYSTAYCDEVDQKVYEQVKSRQEKG